MVDEWGKRPAVSIVVPVYNSEKYLEECLQSLLQQTLADIEIVAVNDGSTDGSLSLLKEHASEDSRIKIIDKENEGVSVARNAGIDAARGEFILFVDSDDYIRRDACEILVSVARENAAEIVVFSGKTFPTRPWADGWFADKNKAYKGSEVIGALFAERGSYPMMCNKLYSADLIRRTGSKFNSELTLGEDHAFQLCIFPAASAVAYTEEKLYFYRAHDGSSLDFGLDVLDEKIFKHLDVVRFVFERWRSEGLLPKYDDGLLRWAIDFLHNDMMRVSFNRRIQASEILREMVEEFFTSGIVETFDPVMHRLACDILYVKRAFQREPLVTFVVLSATDGDYPSKNLWTILNQDELRIRCIIDEQCVTDSIREMVDNDMRCSIENTRNAQGLISRIESRFTVITYTNCRYSERTVENILVHLDNIGLGHPTDRFLPDPNDLGKFSIDFDAFVFTDLHGRIRPIDPFASIRPSVSNPLGKEPMYTFEELGPDAYGVVSLLSANKLFRTSFLAKHMPENDAMQYRLDVQAVLSLRFAQNIMISGMPMLYFESFRSRESGLEWGITGTIDDFLDYRSSITEGKKAGFDNALALACLAIDESITDYEKASSVCATLLSALDIVSLSNSSNSQVVVEEDLALLESLCAGDSTSHYIEMLEAELERVLKKNVELIQALELFERDRNRMANDILEYENSISYRVGRLVTLPLRVIVNGIKIVLKR